MENVIHVDAIAKNIADIGEMYGNQIQNDADALLPSDYEIEDIARVAIEAENICVDCGVYVLRYILTPDLYKKIELTKDSKRLCYACLINRIGRPLTADDFEPCLINQHLFLGIQLAQEANKPKPDNEDLLC